MDLRYSGSEMISDLWIIPAAFRDQVPPSAHSRGHPASSTMNVPTGDSLYWRDNTSSSIHRSVAQVGIRPDRTELDVVLATAVQCAVNGSTSDALVHSQISSGPVGTLLKRYAQQAGSDGRWVRSVTDAGHGQESHGPALGGFRHGLRRTTIKRLPGSLQFGSGDVDNRRGCR
ncbi:hypothetical protein PBRA_002826 [Plasmodiophora brassicae]|uniref:Uncharacterized protein n=1 Tax=Plasmodiophora brassicae TaxID=37360 RepID=A0A0G4J664_PLABS|nr:hypothetical protein PBRA_002826 [Plasmodiophora brassicae]